MPYIGRAQGHVTRAHALCCRDLLESLPYLVLIIGVENIVVITKSVVETSVQLDVKLRVAQGECETVNYVACL